MSLTTICAVAVASIVVALMTVVAVLVSFVGNGSEEGNVSEIERQREISEKISRFIGNRSEEGNGSETEREISEISAGEREAGGREIFRNFSRVGASLSKQRGRRRGGERF